MVFGGGDTDHAKTATDFFSRTAEAARKKFVLACRPMGLLPTTYRAPGQESGPPLADVVRLGNENARRLLVLCGGNRACDALCGSAVQVGWLTDFGTAHLPPDMAILLVHHGAAPPSGGEDNLALPEVPQWDDDILAKVEERYAAYAREKGLDSQGNPLPAPDSANRIPGFPPEMLDAMAPTLFRGEGERIAIIDIRLGLGAYGEAEVTACQPPDSHGARRARTWFALPEAAEDETPSQQLADSMAAGLARRVQVPEITTVALEFGTYSMLSVLDSLAARPPGRSAPDTRRLLHPDGADWKEAVWHSAIVAIQRALTGLQR